MGGYDQSWLLARALLANMSNHQVLGLSRPGYLGTPQSLGRTPETQASLYARLLDALGIERTVVAAVSAGGPSAIQFALLHPDRCAGLILVSTATGPLETAPAFLARLRKMAWLARLPGLIPLMRRRALSNPLASAMRSMPDRATAERTLAHPEAGALFVALQRSALTHVTRRLPGTVTDTTYYQSMPAPPYHRITAPTLAIHGDTDPVVPVSHARQVLEAAPHATGLILSGGHTALFSDLDAIRKAVDDFMTRQTA
jgi:pimeloyl-ACP methyl ester carboxylesterase